VLDHVEVRRRAAAPTDADDVETDRARPRGPVLAQPLPRERADPSLLLDGHRLHRGAERVAAARLHLAEHDQTQTRGSQDEVELAPPTAVRAPVAVEHLVAPQLVPPRDERLAGVPERAPRVGTHLTRRARAPRRSRP